MTISRRWGNKISRKTVPRPWRTPKRGYLHGPLRSQSNCTHPSRRRCRGSARSTKECRESALAARVARAQLQDLQNEIVALHAGARVTAKSAPRWRKSANDGSKTSCALPHHGLILAAGQGCRTRPRPASPSPATRRNSAAGDLQPQTVERCLRNSGRA